MDGENDTKTISADANLFENGGAKRAVFVGKRAYLGVKTCEVFLCFVAIVRVRVCYVDFFVFFVFTSLVSVTGFYTEDEP